MKDRIDTTGDIDKFDYQNGIDQTNQQGPCIAHEDPGRLKIEDEKGKDEAGLDEIRDRKTRHVPARGQEKKNDERNEGEPGRDHGRKDRRKS